MTGETNKERWLTVALLAPTTALFVVLLVMPLVVVVIFSLGERSPMGGDAAALTLEQYAN